MSNVIYNYKFIQTLHNSAMGGSLKAEGFGDGQCIAASSFVKPATARPTLTNIIIPNGEIGKTAGFLNVAFRTTFFG